MNLNESALNILFLIMRPIIIATISFIIVLGLCFVFTYKKQLESFVAAEKIYISEIYKPSYLERKPLICYISKPEEYLDRRFFEETLRGFIARSSEGFERTYVETLMGFEDKRVFPMNITSDPFFAFNADIALLPEPIILKEVDENGEFPYNHLSHLKDLSWSIIQNMNSINKIESFYDLHDKHIYIKGGGYVESLWKDISKFFNYKKQIKITIYTDEKKAVTALGSNKCDGILTLMTHPNPFTWNMSYELKINIVPLQLKQENIDIFSYFLKGLRQTKISVKEYRYPDLKTEFSSYGYSLSLYVRKSLHPDIVKKITEIVFKPKGIIRSAAVGGSEFIPYHKGTSEWLEDQGFLSIADKTEHPGCSLLTGRSKCEGVAKKIAIKEYETNFWGSEELNEQNALPFLRNAYKNKNDEDYGEVYNTAINDSFMCFEDLNKRTQLDCELNGNTWDRPCLTDSECPFFQENKNYPNQYGKCMKDGFCQMPLGVIRKGYRKYDENTKPICHNCPPENPSCCTQNSTMPSPDLAFEKDIKDRLKHKTELNLRGILL